MGVREKPTIRVSGGKRFFRRNSNNAGISLRLVKSPEAPKITIVYAISQNYTRRSKSHYRVETG